MPTDQLHHSGVLVSDIDRAAAFYLDVFDGHWLFKPAVNRGEAAQKVFGGTPDVAFAFCYIGFRTGAIELVQFLEGAPDYAGIPKRVLRPDIYMEAMKEINVKVTPPNDTKITLFDSVFDSRDPEKYARSFAINSLNG